MVDNASKAQALNTNTRGMVRRMTVVPLTHTTREHPIAALVSRRHLQW